MDPDLDQHYFQRNLHNFGRGMSTVHSRLNRVFTPVYFLTESCFQLSLIFLLKRSLLFWAPWRNW